MTEKSREKVRLCSVRLTNALTKHLELSNEDMTNETISNINKTMDNHKNGI